MSDSKGVLSGGTPPGPVLLLRDKPIVMATLSANPIIELSEKYPSCLVDTNMAGANEKSKSGSTGVFSGGDSPRPVSSLGDDPVVQNLDLKHWPSLDAAMVSFQVKNGDSGVFSLAVIHSALVVGLVLCLCRNLR